MVPLSKVCIGYICLSFVFIWRLIFLTKSGQSLITSIKQSKKDLEDYILEIRPEQLRGHSWSILLSRLDNHSQIALGSAFGLSNKNLIAAFSVLLTYLIVLIQFKLSGY